MFVYCILLLPRFIRCLSLVYIGMIIYKFLNMCPYDFMILR